MLQISLTQYKKDLFMRFLIAKELFPPALGNSYPPVATAGRGD
jgi:hypothetical protein